MGSVGPHIQCSSFSRGFPENWLLSCLSQIMDGNWLTLVTLEQVRKRPQFRLVVDIDHLPGSVQIKCMKNPRCYVPLGEGRSCPWIQYPEFFWYQQAKWLNSVLPVLGVFSTQHTLAAWGPARTKTIIWTTSWHSPSTWLSTEKTGESPQLQGSPWRRKEWGEVFNDAIFPEALASVSLVLECWWELAYRWCLGDTRNKVTGLDWSKGLKGHQNLWPGWLVRVFCQWGQSMKTGRESYFT